MNAKRLSLFALSVLSLVFVIGLTSAIPLSISSITLVSQPSGVYQDGSTFNVVFNLTSTGTGSVDFSASTVSAGGTINFDTSSISTSPTTVTATITYPVTANKTIFGTIDAYDGTAHSKLQFSIPVTQDLPTEVTNCLTTGNPGSNLKINGISFTDNGLPVTNMTFGDGNTWFPFENINAKVDVKSINSSNDLTNIEVDWGIWDKNKQQWVILPSELKNIDLSGGKTKTLYQSFSIDNNMDVDLSGLTNGNHYQFYAIANGQDSKNNNVCAYKAESAGIAIESDFVIIKNLNIPSTVQCGQNVQVTGELYNIGNNDQNSVSMNVIGADQTLQLSKNVPIGDINAFDNKQFSFSFNVPGAITEGPYSMKIDILDENNNIFQESTNNHNAEFLIPFTVQGGCSLNSQVSVTASVVSGGQAGKPLQVKTTITNTGTTQRTYTVSASGYNTWASSASVSQGTLTLAPGQSYDVTTTLNVNSNALGDQTYSLDLTSGTQNISQPVTVTIQSGGLNLPGGTLLWVLGLAVLILLIIVIVIAIRVGRK